MSKEKETWWDVAGINPPREDTDEPNLTKEEADAIDAGKRRVYRRYKQAIRVRPRRDAGDPPPF
jgi:hypothetical protein